MSKTYQIKQNNLGYYEVMPKPSKEDLTEFYTNKYFQRAGRYDHSYSDEEISYTHYCIDRKFSLLKKTFNQDYSGKKLLEIGVGEGWTISFLNEKGLDVKGIDFSDFAVKHHNEHIAEKIILGDPDSIIYKMIEDDLQFDLIWLDNVLEHTPDPNRLLTNLNKISAPNAAIVIEVPNDYSIVQLELKDREMIKSNYWESSPEHLSYFNIDALKKLAKVSGWEYVSGMSDFPVDLFLFNEASNYNIKPEVGKKAHHARIAFELLMQKQDEDKVLLFYKTMMDLGLGREITAIFKKEQV